MVDHLDAESTSADLPIWAYTWVRNTLKHVCRIEEVIGFLFYQSLNKIKFLEKIEALFEAVGYVLTEAEADYLRKQNSFPKK